ALSHSAFASSYASRSAPTQSRESSCARSSARSSSTSPLIVFITVTASSRFSYSTLITSPLTLTLPELPCRFPLSGLGFEPPQNLLVREEPAVGFRAGSLALGHPRHGAGLAREDTGQMHQQRWQEE